MRTPYIVRTGAVAAIAMHLSVHIVQAQSFIDEFNDPFDDGRPVEWQAFGEERGVVSVSEGLATFDSITGASPTFGIGSEVPHADVITEMTVQFEAGRENTFLFNVFRITDGGEYWAAVSQAGELGIGYPADNGDTVIAIRDTFLPSGAFEPDDVVNIRTAAIGSTITHSAWLDGTSVSDGATISWTDSENRNPIGDSVAISLNANSFADARVNVHDYRLTIVPEPSSVLLALIGTLVFVKHCQVEFRNEIPM